MSTLHTIASNILNIAKITPDDVMYSSKIISAAKLFKTAYAKRVRDSLNKGQSAIHFTTTYEVELVEDSIVGRLVSLNPIYIPIRVDHYGNSPFTSVGSVDGIQVFVFVTPTVFEYMQADNLLINVPCYSVINDHLVIGNRNLLDSVYITAPFEEPHLVDFGNEEVRRLEDGEELTHEFPCPTDMINSISVEVAQLLANVQSK